MTKQDLYRYFDDPGSSELSSKEFRELLDDYPCFTAAHILFLFELNNEDSGEFEEKLNIHGIYFRDRRHAAGIIKADLFPQLVEAHRKTDSLSPGETEETETESKAEDLLEFGYQDKEDKQEEPGGESDIPDEQEEKADEEMKEADKNESSSFTSWIDRVSEKEEKEKLIDEFLSNEVGPIRADKETGLKGDISSDSVEEDDNFITDTLAKIYVKQGMYSKAIFAYEKLSLKFPEKSVYFASQIEEIKRILKK